MLIEEINRTVCCRKFVNGTGGKTKLFQNVLPVSAVFFNFVSIGAAANNVQSFETHLVLKLSAMLGSIFKKNDALIASFTYPGKLVAPFIHVRDKPREDVAAQFLCDVDFDVVTFGKKPQIERAQIAIVTDAQETHEWVQRQEPSSRDTVRLLDI